jgi:hypothetical protein
MVGIGLVSNTLMRCLIQAVPAALAFAAILTGYAWSSSATIPIFSFWMIMVGNALLVGRLQHPPSALELVLTTLTGLFSLVGMVASVGNSKGDGRLLRLVAGVMWFFLQIAALFASIRA